MVRGLFTVPAVVLAIGLPVTATAQTSADRTRLSALWTLNSELSEKPDPTLGKGDTDDGGRGGMDRGGGSGMRVGGMGGGMMGGRPDPEEVKLRIAARTGMVRSFREASERFTLIFRQQNGAIVITYADGRMATLMADGKKYKEPLPDGATADRVTKWKDGALITELRSNDMKLTHTFGLLEEGSRMAITSVLEMPHADKPLSVRRIYDRQ
jgi:hypothetical protein